MQPDKILLKMKGENKAGTEKADYSSAVTRFSCFVKPVDKDVRFCEVESFGLFGQNYPVTCIEFSLADTVQLVPEQAFS